MAAPSYSLASVGLTDAGGAWSFSVGLWGTAPDVGDIIIVQLFQDGSTVGAVAATSWTDVEALDGTDSSATSIGSFQVGSPTVGYQHLWIGRVIGTGLPTVGGTNSTSEDLYIRMYAFKNVSTGTTLATVIENSTAGSTANTNATDGTITDAGVTTLGPDRLALQFIGISDDNALADFTGETGGNWTEAVAEYAESSGTDATIGLQISPPSALGSLDDNLALAGPQGSGGTSEEIAQSFATSGAITTAAVWVKLRKVGSPADNLIIEIQTDSSGAPSGSVVATVATVAGSSLTTTSTLYQYAVTASLSASTTYWLVLRRSGARDTSNFYSHSASAASTYSGGARSLKSSGTWTPQSDDLCFAVLSTADQTGVTINGGTTTNSDATDGWGVVGFALIGTTVAATYQPRYGFVHYNDPAIV